MANDYLKRMVKINQLIHTSLKIYISILPNTNEIVWNLEI